jgi:hypothetical protein
MSEWVECFDREIEELIMALKNPKRPGRCRGFAVVPWKFGLGETLPPIKAAEEDESAKRRNSGKS